MNISTKKIYALMIYYNKLVTKTKLSEVHMISKQ
jgi:hypothetical protein